MKNKVVYVNVMLAVKVSGEGCPGCVATAISDEIDNGLQELALVTHKDHTGADYKLDIAQVFFNMTVPPSEN